MTPDPALIAALEGVRENGVMHPTGHDPFDFPAHAGEHAAGGVSGNRWRIIHTWRVTSARVLRTHDPVPGASCLSRWEVRAELVEAGTEVVVHEVDVPSIDYRRAGNQFARRLARGGIDTLLRSQDTGLLLSLADIEDNFTSRPAAQVLLCHIVLALTLPEADKVDTRIPGSAPGLSQIAGSSDPSGPMRERDGHGLPERASAATTRLQHRHVGSVEVQPVETLKFQCHVILKDVIGRPCYRHLLGSER